MTATLFITMMVGFVVFMTGIVWANVAAYKMMKIADKDLPDDQRVAPWRVLGKGAAFYKRARYRAKYADGPLNRSLRIGYWLCGIGAVLLFGSALVGKVTPLH